MADHILSDRESVLNLSVNHSVFNNLCESIAKACSLAQITLCADFWCFNEKVQYDYCWIGRSFGTSAAALRSARIGFFIIAIRRFF